MIRCFAGRLIRLFVGKTSFSFVLSIFFSLPVSFAQEKTTPVEIVFCIDLSASTNGILDRFRDHLWDYVHFFDQCSPKGNFKIGFVAFSRPSYKRENSYVKVIQDLSDDYESLSHELLQIKSTIEKGDQFVGAALTVCAKNISWSKDSGALKIVFLVGNGMANTGEVGYEKPAMELAAKGVIINSIYCLEPASAFEKRGWERIAEIGNGKFNIIDIKNVYYESLHGFDIDKFHSLNKKFNDTYLYYGKGGFTHWRLQCQEDDYMYTYNTEGYRYRVQYKLSNHYQQKNSDWDLVDLHYKDAEQVYRQDRLTMPDTLKNMTSEDIRAFVIFNKYQRKLLARKITRMITEREEKEKAEGRIVKKTMNTLDIISINTLRDLLVEKGYILPEESSEEIKN
ncbi:MAG: VWA domain-containing protein [Bacteroidetes bacterium]|nr:VWA domain-containing protein [Bacteroidota bacterium]